MSDSGSRTMTTLAALTFALVLPLPVVSPNVPLLVLALFRAATSTKIRSRCVAAIALPGVTSLQQRSARR